MFPLRARLYPDELIELRQGARATTSDQAFAAQGDRQGQLRAMPSGKIVARSSWSTGTASRRARSRRAYGRGYVQGVSPQEAAEQAAVSAYNPRSGKKR
jgi:hypothetical protein